MVFDDDFPPLAFLLIEAVELFNDDVLEPLAVRGQDITAVELASHLPVIADLGNSVAG